MTTDDMALVQEYARSNSEEAFAMLVSRHIGLVYSVALRQVNDPSVAEEITQAVFVILVRKARSLSPKTVLSGWLCRTTRYVSANALTMQRRRQRREQEAYMQSLLEESGSDTWEQIAPLLEHAMEQLGEKDHNAIVLRFYEGKSFKEVGAALGANEDAAKMRVSRALEKLRTFFSKRGVVSTTAIIAGAISANSVHAAPIGLAATITVTAAKGAVTSTSTLTLAKGALKLMAWTKAKMALVVGISLLAVGGTTTVVVKEMHAHDVVSEAVWTDFNELIKAPPLLVLRPTKFPPERGGGEQSYNGNFRARCMSQAWLMSFAYDSDSLRTILPPDSPEAYYDLLLAKPNSKQDLRAQIENQLGFVARREIRETEVLALRTKNANATGIHQPSTGQNTTMTTGSSQYSATNADFSIFVSFLENYFGKLVINHTELHGSYDIELHWNPGLDAETGKQELTQALLDKLGLELAPSLEPAEMLVVERVKN